MRHVRTLTRALMPMVVTAAVIGSVSTTSSAGDDNETAPRAECTYDASRVGSGRDLWRVLSREAELIAPSGLRQSSDAAGASRRRAVAPPPPATFTARNFIDTEIFGKMVQDHVVWTGRSTDEEFLRRVSLDLAGVIPTAEKVKSFVADASPDKRDKVIDELLASDDFSDRWTMWFGDLVQNVVVSANIREYPQGRNAYYAWIRDSIRSGKPYDQMVREAITATGPSFTSGAANFWVRQIQTNGPQQDTYDNLSAFTGEKFLALPLNCLSCHNGAGHLEAVNSSLSRRARYDFWKNAAFFAQVTATPKRDSAANTVEYTVADNTTGSYRLNTTSGNKVARQPQTGQSSTVDPAFFLTGEGPQPNEPRRVAYARILTAHPQFARAAVNYVWKELFGLGIVEPADSFDLLRQDPATLAPGATLQPTHPELLSKLADSFVASGYNLRSLLRTIVQSNAYQLSSRYTPGSWSEAWTPYHARHYPRRIMAEALLDSLTRATGVPLSMNVNGLGAVTKAMALPDVAEPGPRSTYGPMLDAFGRGDRDTTPRSRDGSIVQALEMLNDSVVTSRVKAAATGSTVGKVLAASKDPGSVADELYLATLSRRPTPAERDAAIAQLKNGDLRTNAENLQFVLLNRLEFLFN